MRAMIGACLTLSAVLLGVAMAAADHGQTLGVAIAAGSATTAAFVAGVLVGASDVTKAGKA